MQQSKRQTQAEGHQADYTMTMTMTCTDHDWRAYFEDVAHFIFMSSLLT